MTRSRAAGQGRDVLRRDEESGDPVGQDLAGSGRAVEADDGRARRPSPRAGRAGSPRTSTTGRTPKRLASRSPRRSVGRVRGATWLAQSEVADDRPGSSDARAVIPLPKMSSVQSGCLCRDASANASSSRSKPFWRVQPAGGDRACARRGRPARAATSGTALGIARHRRAGGSEQVLVGRSVGLAVRRHSARRRCCRAAARASRRLRRL